jgi:HD-GYP domain-containing protein (c-di-GMP phosphodiesterase class II)
MSAGQSERAPVNRPLQAYVCAVIALGAFALWRAGVASLQTPSPIAWIALGSLAVVSGYFKLDIVSIPADVAIDDTFMLATAILFGPAPATLALAASAFASRRRRLLRQTIFNAASFAISMWGAAHAFFWISGTLPLAEGGSPIGHQIAALTALTVVLFALNTGLTATAIGLDSRQSPLLVWRQHFQWLAVSYFGAGSVAFILILLVQQANIAAAVVVLPLLAAVYRTLRVSSARAEDARRHLADMDRLYLSTVETLAMAIDAKDDVTHSHVRRVQAYAMALARAVDVEDEPTLKALEAASLLHDTGKLAIPDHILNKPGKLTTAEFAKMQLHADIGADILSLVSFPFPVEPIVRAHHENWDGSGYPRGLAGEAIPIGARILSVVDCFDALTSDRPYRRKLSEAVAIAILEERRGSMYDPRLVDTFIRIYRGVEIAQEETAEQREVLRRIRATRHADDPVPAATTPAAMTHDLLAFVSLARIAAGEHSLLDALGLASTLVGDMLPGTTGAWYVHDEAADRLTVADAFGPQAARLAGREMPIGERLSGWVAAKRQPILDGDAALDLGPGAPLAMRRCIGVPLVAGNSLVGVLTIYAPADVDLPADRARLVQVVAPHLAVTIHAALARERERTARSTAAAERPRRAPLSLVANTRP